MPKLIQLRISKMKYSGDSIGDDIKMEIDCLGNSVDFKRKIKCGSEVSPNLALGSFVSENKSFDLSMDIKIIEEDLIFNDVGNKSLNLKIDLKSDAVKTEICKIEVMESRNFISKNKALLEVFVEISIKEAEMYISKMDSAWLIGLSESEKEKIALSNYLKVQLEKSDSSRQYFRILEGIRRGEKASVKYKEDGQSFLEVKNHQTEPVHLVYSISQKILRFGKSVYKTVDYPSNLWKKGFYDIEIPDAPHVGGRNYPEAKMSKVWFRIGHDGYRYLHIGRRSLGCLTLTEVNRWDELCDILLKARKGDSMSIGVLEVTD